MNLGFPFAAARPGFRTWCREGRKRNFSPLLLDGRIFGRSFALRASVLNVRICRGALAAIEALQDYGNHLLQKFDNGAAADGQPGLSIVFRPFAKTVITAIRTQRSNPASCSRR